MVKKLGVLFMVGSILYVTGCARGVSKETLNQLEEARKAVEAAQTTLNECNAEKENLINQKVEKGEMLKNLQAEKDSLANLLELIKQGY